jgi:hypothetical protein
MLGSLYQKLAIPFQVPHSIDPEDPIDRKPGKFFINIG